MQSISPASPQSTGVSSPAASDVHSLIPSDVTSSPCPSASSGSRASSASRESSPRDDADGHRRGGVSEPRYAFGRTHGDPAPGAADGWLRLVVPRPMIRDTVCPTAAQAAPAASSLEAAQSRKNLHVRLLAPAMDLRAQQREHWTVNRVAQLLRITARAFHERLDAMRWGFYSLHVPKPGRRGTGGPTSDCAYFNETAWRTAMRCDGLAVPVAVLRTSSYRPSDDTTLAPRVASATRNLGGSALPPHSFMSVYFDAPSRPNDALTGSMSELQTVRSVLAAWFARRSDAAAALALAATLFCDTCVGWADAAAIARAFVRDCMMRQVSDVLGNATIVNYVFTPDVGTIARAAVNSSIPPPNDRSQSSTTTNVAALVVAAVADADRCFAAALKRRAALSRDAAVIGAVEAITAAALPDIDPIALEGFISSAEAMWRRAGRKCDAHLHQQRQRRQSERQDVRHTCCPTEIADVSGRSRDLGPPPCGVRRLVMHDATARAYVDTTISPPIDLPELQQRARVELASLRMRLDRQLQLESHGIRTTDVADGIIAAALAQCCVPDGDDPTEKFASSVDAATDLAVLDGLGRLSVRTIGLLNVNAPRMGNNANGVASLSSPTTSASRGDPTSPVVSSALLAVSEDSQLPFMGQWWPLHAAPSATRRYDPACTFVPRCPPALIDAVSLALLEPDRVTAAQRLRTALGYGRIPAPSTLRLSVWRALLEADTTTSAGSTLRRGSPPAGEAGTACAVSCRRGAADFARSELDVSSCDRQLLLDLPRCHPHEVLTRQAEGRDAMYRLVRRWLDEAAAVPDPPVGSAAAKYWQGVDSMAAAVLWAGSDDEATAAWCLVKIIDDFVPGRAHPTAIRDRVQHISATLRFHDPFLASHLEEVCGVMVDHFSLPWVLTAFAHVLPLPLVCHLWDAALCYGVDRVRFLNAFAVVVVRSVRLRIFGATDLGGCIEAVRGALGALLPPPMVTSAAVGASSSAPAAHHHQQATDGESVSPGAAGAQFRRLLTDTFAVARSTPATLSWRTGAPPLVDPAATLGPSVTATVMSGAPLSPAQRASAAASAPPTSVATHPPVSFVTVDELTAYVDDEDITSIVTSAPPAPAIRRQLKWPNVLLVTVSLRSRKALRAEWAERGHPSLSAASSSGTAGLLPGGSFGLSTQQDDAASIASDRSGGKQAGGGLSFSRPPVATSPIAHRRTGSSASSSVGITGAAPARKPRRLGPVAVARVALAAGSEALQAAAASAVAQASGVARRTVDAAAAIRPPFPRGSLTSETAEGGDDASQAAIDRKAARRARRQHRQLQREATRARAEQQLALVVARRMAITWSGREGNPWRGSRHVALSGRGGATGTGAASMMDDDPNAGSDDESFVVVASSSADSSDGDVAAARFVTAPPASIPVHGPTLDDAVAADQSITSQVAAANAVEIETPARPTALPPAPRISIATARALHADLDSEALAHVTAAIRRASRAAAASGTPLLVVVASVDGVASAAHVALRLASDGICNVAICPVF